MKFISIFLIVWIILPSISCKINTYYKPEFINTSLDSSIITTKISIKDLAKKFKSLHGQYIETEGVFYWEFENVSICVDHRNCFWLRFNRNLKLNDTLLTERSTQRFIIKGMIDTSNTGHLGRYLASIQDIYYLKQK